MGHYFKTSSAKTWLIPQEEIKQSHSFSQNTTLAHILFLGRMSRRRERRRGINLCSYLRTRRDPSCIPMQGHTLHIMHQNPWRTTESDFMWSWQPSIEYSRALTPPDVVMEVYCKRYLLSAIRFAVDVFLT